MSLEVINTIILCINTSAIIAMSIMAHNKCSSK
jgi:hypothetical protein